MTDPSSEPIRSPLRHLDVASLGESARHEARRRQHHLPPISTYRWWARRTETITGAIIDAVSRDTTPTDAHSRLTLADPFAGGGVIALAGLLRGHRMYAQDVNPWAAQSLTTMLTLPPASVLSAAGDRLHEAVRPLLERAYNTTTKDGTPAMLAHTLRVTTGSCPQCAARLRLFPTGLASLLSRVDLGGTKGFVACRVGHLTLADTRERVTCAEPSCQRDVVASTRYTTNRSIACHRCRWHGKIAELEELRWEVALVERVAGGRREIAEPTPEERLVADDSSWPQARELPAIADGIETRVLRRHGLVHWHDLYPARQRTLIKALLDACPEAAQGDMQIERALQAAVLGSVEMAGYLSRWDTRYLKPYEAVANHRFNFTTLSAEPNVWGTKESGRGTVSRRLEQLTKATLWLQERLGNALNVEGPLTLHTRRTALRRDTDARVVAGSSERLVLPTASLDACITDPPYHDDVHYGELSDLFRAWTDIATGRLDGDTIVRRTAEDTSYYAELLHNIFLEVRRALKPRAHLILSYANRAPSAWVALFSALQAAGFQAVGYTVVHSENEIDNAKRGKRTCTLDVLLDLVVANAGPVEQHRPGTEPTTDEERCCRLIGEQALRIGALVDGWATTFCQQMRNSAFLSTTGIRSAKGRRDQRYSTTTAAI